MGLWREGRAAATRRGDQPEPPRRRPKEKDKSGRGDFRLAARAIIIRRAAKNPAVTTTEAAARIMGDVARALRQILRRPRRLSVVGAYIRELEAHDDAAEFHMDAANPYWDSSLDMDTGNDFSAALDDYSAASSLGL